MRLAHVVAVVAAVGTATLVAAGQVQEGDATRATSLAAAPTAAPIPAGRQVFYDIGEVPWLDFGAGVKRKTLLGEATTFSMAQLDPAVMRGRSASAGHHHDYEQVLFGLEGAYDQSAADQIFRLDRWAAVLEPPNVQHTVTRLYGPEKSVSIEFIPLARRELLPPRPKVDYPASPAPRPIPAGRQVFLAFAKAAWVGNEGEPRFKALVGETCSLVLWHLPASGFKGVSSPGHHHTAEQITYVLEGRARMRVGDQVRTAGPGTVIMIPADVEHLPMSAVDGEDVVLLDFQPAVRTDLLERMRKR